MAQRDILVVGSLNMDQVVRVPRIPSMGETLLGAGSLQLVPGGKGANQAVTMARLGARVKMAGRVGTDPFGGQLLGALQRDAIDTQLVVVDQQEASGVAFIFLGPDGDNAIVVASGANMRVGLDSEQQSAILTTLPESSALVLQLEIPVDTVQALVSAGYDAHIPVVLNLAPAQSLPQELLRRVTVLIVNESEASLLGGQPVETLEDAYRVGTMLRERGIAMIALTLGSRGALLFIDDGAGGTRILQQSVPRVSVVDTTAAGDCFVGALTVALIERQAPEDMLRFAVAASALKVTKFGAQSGLPTREEVQSLLHTLP